MLRTQKSAVPTAQLGLSRPARAYIEHNGLLYDGTRAVSADDPRFW